MDKKEIWLSLDLSTPKGGLAIHSAGPDGLSRLGATDLEGPHRQSELLLPAIDKLLGSQSLSTLSISRLIVGAGPGSFTGLRIGFAFAKGFAAAIQIPVETIRGSEARARAYLRKNGTTEVTVLTTLTPRSLFWERFESGTLRILGQGTVHPNDFVMPSDAIITDERIDAAKGIQLPCSATLLAEGVFERDTLQDSQTKEALIRLAPDYNGGEHFEPGKR